MLHRGMSFNYHREGWLAKVNAKQTEFHMRYCVLTGDTIYYFPTKPAKGVRVHSGFIALSGTVDLTV